MVLDRVWLCSGVSVGLKTNLGCMERGRVPKPVGTHRTTLPGERNSLHILELFLKPDLAACPPKWVLSGDGCSPDQRGQRQDPATLQHIGAGPKSAVGAGMGLRAAAAVKENLGVP